jgi:choline dehydrogenase-like flavoprotein
VIEDFVSLQDGLELAADVCIIGSGPAGLTIASQLCNSRLQVVVLEAGGFEYEDASQKLYQGALTGHPYPLAGTRLRQFGGTSGHWVGQCAPLMPRHMAARSGLTEARWPLRFGDLLPYYQRANELLQLGHFDYQIDEERRRTYGLTDPADGPLDPVFWRRRADDALRFGPHMRQAMHDAANIRVLLHASVTRLITNAQASQLERVRFATLDGKTGTVRARCFVLACGGLEVPRLLLNTTDVQRTGLGNARDLVGRHFMEHPNAVIGHLHLADRRAAAALARVAERGRDRAGPVGQWIRTLGLSERFERDQGTSGGYYRFRNPEPSWRDQWIETVASGDASLLERFHGLARLFDDRAYAEYRARQGFESDWPRFDKLIAEVYVEFEQLPNPESRVTLTADRDVLGLRRLSLDWRLTEREVATARALGNALGQEATLRNWGRFRFAEWLTPDAGAEATANFSFSCHHIGTARMASAAQNGVVDTQCRLFGCDNLYVGGSAVFPTASFVNPTMTIVALAFRIAEHLRTRLG